MNKILKVLSFLLTCVLLVSFVACSNENDNTTSPSDTSSQGVSTNGMSVYLECDTLRVAPGEQFTVHCYVKDCPLFAAGDLNISFDANKLSYELNETEINSLYTMSDTGKSDFTYSAYVLKTLDLSGEILFSVTFTVAEDCESGEQLSVSLSCISWLLGTDESGDETVEKADLIEDCNIVVTVE